MVLLATLDPQFAQYPVAQVRYPVVSANTCAVASDLSDNTSDCAAARQTLAHQGNRPRTPCWPARWPRPRLKAQRQTRLCRSAAGFALPWLFLPHHSATMVQAKFDHKAMQIGQSRVHFSGAACLLFLATGVRCPSGYCGLANASPSCIRERVALACLQRR